MLAQVERLGRLVKQLLDLSRLESGAVPLDARRFAVEPLLERVATTGGRARLHAASACRSSSSPTDLVADGDPERVHQVVANLLENAVRHTPRGGAVEVGRPRERARRTIEVIDEGPGIPRRRGRAGLRALLPRRLGALVERRRRRARPRDRALDRRPPRRRHPARANGRRTAAAWSWSCPSEGLRARRGADRRSVPAGRALGRRRPGRGRADAGGGRRRASRLSLLRLTFGLLACALAAQAALLDAAWVVSLDLTAAWILASLAAAGPLSLR